MHDRRIDGVAHTFGNYGALWMRAMTWYDHETNSIWSQPWGRALTGELKGTQLQIIPFSLTPWSTWLEEHPDSLALLPDEYAFVGVERPYDDFVAGLAIGDTSRAYPYRTISEQVVTNDELDGIPLVVHVNAETRSIHLYIRRLNDGRTLTFSGDAEQLIDDETGTVWNPDNGLATDGELAGEALRELPYISAFDWAWFDFYPESTLYQN